MEEAGITVEAPVILMLPSMLHAEKTQPLLFSLSSSGAFENLSP